MLAAEDVLTLNASSDEPVYCILAVVRPTGSNQGPRILLGLEQARDSAKLPAVNADRLALERDHRGEEGGVGLARHQLIEGHEGPRRAGFLAGARRSERLVTRRGECMQRGRFHLRWRCLHLRHDTLTQSPRLFVIQRVTARAHRASSRTSPPYARPGTLGRKFHRRTPLGRLTDAC